MSVYVLEYQVVDRFVERRAAYRNEHLQLVSEAHRRGDLVMAGAVGDPPSGALVVFRGESPAAAEAFARHDPYVTQGLVTAWTVRSWHLVVQPSLGADG